MNNEFQFEFPAQQESGVVDNVAPKEPKPKQTPKKAIRVRAADELETADVEE